MALFLILRLFVFNFVISISFRYDMKTNYGRRIMTASVKFKFLAQCHKCEFHCYFFIVGREILAVSWLCLKYQYASRTLCAYAHVFRKRPGCALIGACALIRMNTIRQIH